MTVGTVRPDFGPLEKRLEIIDDGLLYLLILIRQKHLTVLEAGHWADTVSVLLSSRSLVGWETRQANPVASEAKPVAPSGPPGFSPWSET